ncbi:MAG: hypothetical protein ACJAUG_000353 [Halioglobus sp.]|jgi:hypothetical protein
MQKIELKPLGTMEIELGDTIEVGDGPKGARLVADVLTVKLKGERITAELATNDAADWLTVSDNGKLGALDVRLTLKTDDGAFIYVEYSGRMDMATGIIAVAPTFQTGAPQYSWLNRIQAVAAGTVNTETGLLVYSLYEAVILAE